MGQENVLRVSHVGHANPIGMNEDRLPTAERTKKYFFHLKCNYFLLRCFTNNYNLLSFFSLAKKLRKNDVSMTEEKIWVCVENSLFGSNFKFLASLAS